MTTNRSLRMQIFAIVIGFLLPMCFLEFCVRLGQGELFSTSNFIERRVFENRNKELVSFFDPDLGLMLPKGMQDIRKELIRPIPQNFNRFWKVTYDENGFRSCPSPWSSPITPMGNPILAVGDGFTFGSEVNDEETWPTHLQSILGRKVINAGVGGYGLDEITIRLEKIVSKINPRIVIVAINPAVIERVVQTKKIEKYTLVARDKAFFRKKNELELTRPQTDNTSFAKLHWSKRILGHSLLLDTVLGHFAFDLWYGSIPYWNKFPSEYLSPDSPQEISCLLLKKINTMSLVNNFEVLLLSQDFWNWRGDHQYSHNQNLQKVIDCAKNMDWKLVDLGPELEKLYFSNPLEYETLFFPGTHMTNRGNLFVARALAKKIQ